MKEYTTIAAPVTAETVIEKSRFIAAAAPVDTPEQAMAFVESRRKQFYDATHNCYAFAVGDKAKFSDDGEPQGTAGLPIFECIRQSGLDHICVVVTRYFGGVKLGAGGLVRAYSGCTADCLRTADRLSMTDCIVAEVVADYSFLKPLRKALLPVATEQNVFYEEKVRLLFLFPAVSYNTISDIVLQNTLGKGILTQKERLLAHFEKQR